MEKEKVKMKPQKGRTEQCPPSPVVPPGGRTPEPLGPASPLQRLGAPLSPAPLFKGQSSYPSHITTALHVHCALEMGSRVPDWHRVTSSAPPRPRSPSKPFKGADPVCRLREKKPGFKNRQGGSWQVATRVTEAFALSEQQKRQLMGT